MYSVVLAGDSQLEIEWSGQLSADEMRAFLDELAEKAASIEKGTMLYQIGEFERPTMEALGVELSRLPELFRLIRKFERAAVLCDKQWIRRVSEWEGKLIPGLEIRSFEPGALSEARAWLEQSDP